MSACNSSSYRASINEADSLSNECLLNPVFHKAFDHGLMYSDRTKTSTGNGKFTNYSEVIQARRMNDTPAVERFESSSFRTRSTLSSESSIDSNRFNQRLIYSRSNRNSTVKPRYLRDQYSSLRYSNASTLQQMRYLTAVESNAKRPQPSGRSNDIDETLDENNNFDLSNSETPMCHSYMRNCAIYGIPKEGHDKTWDKLIDWWLFSISYDLKYGFKHMWKMMLVVLILLVFIHMIMAYCRQKMNLIF